jgi:dolichol-phosphate mannosyltransferase
LNNGIEYSIIIPVYNEEKVIKEAYKQITKVLAETGKQSEIIFIDDGSSDNTQNLLKNIAKNNEKIKLLILSRNFGQQAAISAGLEKASGKAIIYMDADLQDPPKVILEMIKKWKDGYDVVYGKRIERKGENIIKKLSASIFYRLLKKMAGYDFPVDVGEFRLIDRKVAEALKKFREKNRYVRGLISWLGFRQTEVEYIRDERAAGETKYTTAKMIKLSLDAITSFTYAPLKLAMYFGFFISGISFIYLLVVLYQGLFTKSTVAGWASITAINLFFNGIVLIILGIYGEYIGRIYEEAKDRPLYIVSESVGFKEKENQ